MKYNDTIKFVDIDAMVQEVLRRAHMGNTLIPKDEPKQLTIGCLDVSKGEWLYIRIVDMHRSKARLSDEKRGFISECFKKDGGKDILFRHNPSQPPKSARLDETFDIEKDIPWSSKDFGLLG